ncbi:MAG: Hpy99I family type II restriction endonuclease [Patescibacteria group bacterium]|mgnify:CR=1 FL=1
MGTKKFVFTNKAIINKGKVVIEKNDVGIIKSETKENASIFFIKAWREVELGTDDFKAFDVKKTGDGFSKKICNICHKLLSTKEFAKNQNAKDNRSVRRPSCGKCRKKLEGTNLSQSAKIEWQKKKPQNEPFECPVCAKRTIAGITCKVVLDHNHADGRVRGWICDSCNTGIGRFQDDINLMEKAIKFLKQP